MKLKIELIFLLVIINFLIIHKSNCQKAEIVFDHVKHDFGMVVESKGKVSHVFSFTNKGKVPLIIQNVKASCGCTTPEWSKDPVAPGKEGFITAEFNPANRPGVFDKTLIVTANTEPPSIQLKIHGMVTPGKKMVRHNLNDTLGSILVQSRYLDFQNITTKVPVQKEFKFMNSGTSEISFSNINAPKHLQVTIVPEKIEPEKTGVIKIVYFPKLKNDFGNVADIISLNTNDKKDSKKIFTVFANITEYFAGMTEKELEVSPRIQFTEIMHDFGEVRKGASETFEFNFSNVGKTDLLIRKIKADCIEDGTYLDVRSRYLQNAKCAPGNCTKMILKPGEAAKIRATLSTSGKSGAQIKTITVYCNDPSNPNPTLVLKAMVNEKL